MVFADFEKNAVNEAIEKKMNVFIIKVSVDENCILKAARAFLVFKNLEGHCDIIKSEPSAQDIEDEKFELDFSIVVVTEESYESIVGIIKNVSEIKDAAGAGTGRKSIRYPGGSERYRIWQSDQVLCYAAIYTGERPSYK